jgi:hypothetical protein
VGKFLIILVGVRALTESNMEEKLILLSNTLVRNEEPRCCLVGQNV